METSSTREQPLLKPSTIIQQFVIRRENIEFLQNLVVFGRLLRGEQTIEDDLLKLTYKSSYHYAFTKIDTVDLRDAEFEIDSQCQVANVTIYLVPHNMSDGEVWLKHTLVEGEDNNTPWSLTFVFNVGMNNIVTGTAVSETVEELIHILELVGFKHFPEVNNFKKRTYMNYKKKYIRRDKVECQFCVSQMGPLMHYQHATLKFPTEIEQAARDLIAENVRTSLKLLPGRSSVVECLRRFHPEAYEQIDKLDYRGEIPYDCYPLHNCFATKSSQLEGENDDHDDHDYCDDYDVRYIPEDLPDCNLERMKEKYRKKYNIEDPNF